MPFERSVTEDWAYDYTWFLFWNNNEDYPIDYILTHQIWFKRLMERIIGKVKNWLGMGLEEELGVVCNLALWCRGKLGGTGCIMQLWFELCNMLNSVTLASSISSFISLFFITIVWLEVFKTKILVQSNVMILVTSFLLYACNLDFSNTFISNLSVTLVFVLFNFLSYRYLPLITVYFCIL